MPAGIPKAVAAQAERCGLSAVRSVHRWRPSGATLWGGTVTVAAAVFIAAAVHELGIAIGLVAAAILAAFATRFGPLPLRWRMVVVHDSGFVYSKGWTVRAVPWERVVRVWHQPNLSDGLLLLVESPGDAEADEENEGDGGDEFVTLGNLAGGAELVAAFLDATQPRALARAREELATTGTADFGVLQVLASGLRRDLDDAHVPWELIAAHRRVGGADGHRGSRVIVFVHPEGSVPGHPAGAPQCWFDDAVPDVIAVTRLMDELDPGYAPVRAEDLVAADLDAERGAAVARTRRGRLRRVRAGIRPGLALAVLVAPLIVYQTSMTGPASSNRQTLPNVPTDFVLSCYGPGFSKLPAYGGAGPHPVEFIAVSDSVAAGDSATITVDGSDSVAGALYGEPTSWIPSDMAQAQVVVCVTIASTGAKTRSCDYQWHNNSMGSRNSFDDLPFTATMYARSYTVEVHEARTGRLLAAPPPIAGADDECPIQLDTHTTSIGEAPTSGVQIYARLTVEQVQQAVGKYIDN